MTNNNQINSASSTVFDGVYRTSKFIRSSRTNPCPVCGRTKDGDCSMSEQNNLVFCHTHQTQPIDTIINGYRYLRDADGGAGWGMFVWDDRDERGDRKGLKVRPAKEPIQYFDYFDRQGNPHIRVCRQKGGTPEFWQQYNINGIWTNASQVPEATKRKMKLSVPLYRHKEVQEAIAAGRPILFVEGETTANALWSIGVPATTAIGGSKGLKSWGKYFEDMKRSQIWTCPDRDEEGLGYADAVQRLFGRLVKGNIKVYPSSPVWDYLPTNHGLDAADWIGEGAIASDFLSQMGESRSCDKNGAAGGAEKKEVDLANLIRSFLATNPGQAEIALTKAQIKRDTKLPGKEFDEFWAVLSQEFETTEEVVRDRDNSISMILQSRQSQIRAREVVSPIVADCIEELSKWQNLREELYFSAYLTAIGSCAKNGTLVCPSEEVDFYAAPNLLQMIVAESSQRKTPAISTIVGKPLMAIQGDLIKEHEAKLEQWEEAKAAAKKNDETFTQKKPELPVVVCTKYSGESILRQVSRAPEYGILVLGDEIAGVFNSRNQYRNGRGSDAEDVLSYYDSNGGIVLRVEGLRDFAPRVNFGMIGGIQPKVLEKFMANADDANGGWARFGFLHQPNTIGSLPAKGQAKKYDFQGIFSTIYRKVMDFEPKVYEFDEVGQTKFNQFYTYCEIKRNTHPSPAMRAAWGKTSGRVAKYALVLHLERAAIAGLDQPEDIISLDLLNIALKRAMLDIHQIESNYQEFDSDNAIASHLAKVVALSRKKGEIRARDVQMQFNANQGRPEPAVVRDWFRELERTGWGKISGENSRLRFIAYAEKRNCGFVGEPVGENVGDSNSIKNAGLSHFVGEVGEVTSIASEIKNDGQEELDRILNFELDYENTVRKYKEENPNDILTHSTHNSVEKLSEQGLESPTISPTGSPTNPQLGKKAKEKGINPLAHIADELDRKKREDNQSDSRSKSVNSTGSANSRPCKNKAKSAKKTSQKQVAAPESAIDRSNSANDETEASMKSTSPDSVPHTYELGDRVTINKEGYEDQTGEVVSKSGNNGTGRYTVELESGETIELNFGELQPFRDFIERRYGF